jgi:hypothetical protein
MISFARCPTWTHFALALTFTWQGAGEQALEVAALAFGLHVVQVGAATTSFMAK